MHCVTQFKAFFRFGLSIVLFGPNSLPVEPLAGAWTKLGGRVKTDADP